MKHYKVIIKETGNPYTLHTSITTEGDLDYVRNYFGLEDADVEWYAIEKQNETQKG